MKTRTLLFSTVFTALVAIFFPTRVAAQPQSVQGFSPSATASLMASLYVDPLISSPSCATYNPTTRSCSGGTMRATSTLSAAAAITAPGDVVLIRQGLYQEQFIPAISGSPGQPITYAAYPNETVTLFSSLSPATIVLNAVSYITIDGVTVDNCRWVEASSAHHITLQNNHFLHTPSSGTTGNVRFISSDYNRIIGNELHSGNDNLLLIDSDHNLVENNTINDGGHSVFGIRCGNFNIIRGNRFANPRQKIGEVYDCGVDTTSVPHAFDATKHNLIENNIFAETNRYYSTSGGNGIQYAGQNGILRRNVFYNNNVGIGMQVYDDEALYNHHNRVFHNVFYDNACAGLSVRGANLDNRYLNNILYFNKGATADCYGIGPAQVLYRTPIAEFYFEGNDIINQIPGELVIQEEFDAGYSLASLTASHPTLFVRNLESNPDFVNETAFDFHLKNTSPMIDAGAFLTTTTTTGSGTALPVNDAGYFFDGFGIAGQTGDLIQLSGQTLRATVLAVDYDAKVLTLDRPLVWSAGQGVSLAYHGAAPDIGAFEFLPDGSTATGFYPVTPCRVLDTRNATGPDAAAPILSAGQRRYFTVSGKCSIPSLAKAISANLTVVGATAEGDLEVIGGHHIDTTTSVLAIPLTRPRANNAIIELASDGSGYIMVYNLSLGSTHFILDVNGYFR